MSELIGVIFIIVFAVAASVSQTIAYWLSTPPGHVYLYAHNFLEDYYYYLHSMRQGFDGMWMATSRMTPDVFAPQLVNLWFLFLGHLARVFDISLPFMYTLARISGGASLLVLSYLLIRQIYKTPVKRLIALVFVAFSTFWWGWNGTVQIPELVRSWTELDPLFRLSYIPHHLWSKVFMLIVFVLLLLKIPKNIVFRTMLVALSVAVMGFASPVILVVFVPVIVLWMIPEIRNRDLSIPALVAVVTALLVTYHHRQVQYSVFPWTGSYIAWENSMRYPITLREFLLSLGPLFIFYCIAVKKLMLNTTSRLMVVWVAMGFILLFVIGPFIPLSNSRYLSGYYFIPIGIGAVEGLYMFSKHIRLILLFLLLGYFCIGLSATWKLHALYIAQNSNNQQVYVPQPVYSAMLSLRGSVVLARYPISTMIPAFSSSRVIAGHALMSVDNEARHREIDRFFTYSMSPEEATAWLRVYRIRYILEDMQTIESDEFYSKVGVKILQKTGSVVVYEL